MQVVLAIALQAAQTIAAGEMMPVTFDLATHRPAAGDGEVPFACRLRDPDELVVCARRRGGAKDYPMDYWARIFATTPLVAETGIAPNTSVRAFTEQVDFGGGQVSKRAMVGVKLKF
jgi:hypothetical protein